MCISLYNMSLKFLLQLQIKNNKLILLLPPKKRKSIDQFVNIYSEYDDIGYARNFILDSTDFFELKVQLKKRVNLHKRK